MIRTCTCRRLTEGRHTYSSQVTDPLFRLPWAQTVQAAGPGMVTVSLGVSYAVQYAASGVGCLMSPVAVPQLHRRLSVRVCHAPGSLPKLGYDQGADSTATVCIHSSALYDSFLFSATGSFMAYGCPVRARFPRGGVRTLQTPPS